MPFCLPAEYSCLEYKGPLQSGPSLFLHIISPRSTSAMLSTAFLCAMKSQGDRVENAHYQPITRNVPLRRVGVGPMNLHLKQAPQVVLMHVFQAYTIRNTTSSLTLFFSLACTALCASAQALFSSPLLSAWEIPVNTS